MAGGEYQVDDYYEMIKKQMKKIRTELQKIRQNRDLKRIHRNRGGFYLISLAGYTNAGKSSLLNLLSEETVNVEGKLFSTLSTTTRRMKNNSIPVLLTDTVGFIQDLPAWVIDAFHSTLEEIENADIVLLVVDISENIVVVENKLKVSLKELSDLGVKSPVFIVFNKVDLKSDNEINNTISYLEEINLINDKKYVLVSIKNRINIDMLYDSIYDFLPNLVRLKISLPHNKVSQSFISWMYERTNVIDISYDDFIIVTSDCNVKIRDKILSELSGLDGIEIKI